VSSLPLTSEDLLRYRRVLDEALATDKLDSMQYRTRIRALVLAASKRDLNALIKDLVPAVGQPGFTDEGHEVPTPLSSKPVEPRPRPWEMFQTSQSSPIDSFPSLPGEEDVVSEEGLVPDEDTALLGEVGVDENAAFLEETGADEDTTRLEDVRSDEDDVHGEKAQVQTDEEPPEPVMVASPGFPEVDGPATHVVPVVSSAPPAVPAETVPGELVPIRQWSVEVSSVEQASTSTALATVGQKPTAELSRRGQRSTDVSQVESRSEAALSPTETDDDGSVNRVVVVMVPSAPSPDEPSVITSSWDELPSADSSWVTSLMEPAEPATTEAMQAEPAPEEAVQAEPVQAEAAPEEPVQAEETMDVPEPEETEMITRISAPISFDDSEAPTQILDAIKDLPIFREDAAPVGENATPPQPVLPHPANQPLSSTPADPMAQTIPSSSAGHAVPHMPPPVPEPSPATLAAMPPPAPPAPNPAQAPWAPSGHDPLATMPPPPEPAVAASPAFDPGHGAASAVPPYVPPPSYGHYELSLPPPSSAPYQSAVPVYSSQPVGRQAPKRRSPWAWVVVTLMVVALLAWIAYLVFFPQTRRSASELFSQPGTRGPSVVLQDGTSQ